MWCYDASSCRSAPQLSDGKKLYDYDPRTLDLERLTLLEKSLMAKLLLVSRELIERYTKLIDLSKDMPNMTDGRKVMAAGVADRVKLNILLENELSHVLKEKDD
jgi:hypothetical protein